MIKRTKLFRGKETEQVSESSNSPLAAPHSEIPDTESARDTTVAIARSVGRGTKTIIGTAAFVVFIIVLIHTALAGSLMFTASVDDKPFTERAWVARGTFVGGKIAPGTTIYGSASTAAPTGFIEKVVEGYLGVPDYFVAEVIAGPVDGVTAGPDEKILVNGKDSGYTGKTENVELKNQYLAVCVSGACEEGDLIIANYESISGEVRGYLYPFGMEEAKSTKDVKGDESK